jgi:hypothetical protein
MWHKIFNLQFLCSIIPDLPRNLQQFGIKNVSEEWKSADFLRNLQQFRTKNPRNGNNFFGGNVTFLKI